VIETAELLKELSEAVGVSGREEAVRQIVYQAVKPLADEIKVDALGNLIALKRGHAANDGLKVMVAAHMDEIGLMITGHEGEGGLKFRPVGGILDQTLAGKRVQVGSDRVPGVIGIKPIHLTKKDESQKVVKMDSLVIDVGASNKEEAEGIAKVGDLATFLTPFADLGPTFLGKAFDDRAGCAALIELVRGEPFSFDLFAVFTVQEEVGLRGARVAAYAVEPDAAIALDCTPANDMPKKKDVSPNTVLGQGPAIYILGGRTFSDRRLIELLIRAGDEDGIPYQIRQPGGGGTDAGSIQLARGGVPVVSVSVPGRYIHSPAAVISRKDFENVPRLVRAALSRLTRDTLARAKGER
jgi:putative aminopeptidase FrvX